jgi:hypothetical protein
MQVTTHLYPTCPECQQNDTATRLDCFAELVLASQKVALARGVTVFLHCHGLSFRKDSHSNLAAIGSIFCRNDRTARG